MSGTILGGDGRRRCWWCGQDSEYVAYHDDEWGMPVVDDQRLFEKICLEGFQAGLSWITILRKRDAFRQAFVQFAIAKVAKLNAADVNRLVTNKTIVRHQGKIRSTINNAQRAVEMIDEFGSLASFFWSHEPKKSAVLRSRSQMQSQSDESALLSKRLKKRGWTFVGPTTCYAFMQSMGIVNDHLRTCDTWSMVEQARKALNRPRVPEELNA